MKTLATRLAVVVLLAGILATAGVALDAGNWREGRLAMALFTVWAVSPYAGFLMLTTWTRRSLTASWIVAIAALAAVLFGVGALVDGFFIHTDAQNGLLFIFIPLWQWVWWVPFAVLSSIMAARKVGAR